MQSLIPSQALRAIYIGVTGASLLALMGLWQNTGVIVWSLPGDPVRVSLISMGIYWILLLSGFSVLARFDLFEFLGLKQIYLPKCTARVSDTGQSLHRSGIFSKVRHPVYLFTLLAILLTPMMSLDRLLLAGGIGLYLSVAIPIEERKLIKEFGRAYTTYRTQVPALIPIRLNRNKPE
jgi:protein-S-isoprenylcysteine O-methyltransferase Ste14